MSKEIYELIISESLVSEEQLSALEDQFNLEGFYSEDGLWHIYFHSTPDSALLAEYLNVAVSELKLARLQETNWNAQWESNFEQVLIKDFCRIYAFFHNVPEGDYEYEILINPKMSFGTGHHATTSMMIDYMSTLNFMKKEVLDFGTGTGVLAILASKMGASSVVANDISIHAYENAIENIGNNDVAGIKILHGGIEVIPQGRSFDVILANVNKKVLEEQADQLIGSLRPGGELIVSGVLLRDEDTLLQHYTQRGVRLNHRNQKNEWICLSFR